MELIEVRARTVELAEQAALEELGIHDRERVDWEILQEPTRGFLGVGAKDAIVRAKRKPAKRRGGRGRKKAKGRATSRPKKQQAKAGTKGQTKRPKQPANRAKQSKSKESKGSTLEEQGEAAKDFLGGLLKALKLPGNVSTRLKENLVIAEVEGDQTEVLVGPRGSGIEALHTISKSVIKRKTAGGARLRLDIAGYASRRREALAIYATGLVEQVTAEGGELMLEPMNAADRKVIHDTVAQHENVRSFSEGQAPQRYVVIAFTA